MKEKLAISFRKYIFGPKTPFHWKKGFFMTLRSIFKVFWVEISCSVRKHFLYVCYISSLFPLQVFTFFCEFIELGSKLGLQRAQFWSWLPEQQNPRNLRAWYIVVIKLLVFLVSNIASGYITRVDELEVILQDVFGRELLHTKAAMLWMAWMCRECGTTMG